MAPLDPQAATPLVDALRRCVYQNHAPFYAPGHKRGRGITADFKELLGAQIFQADLPELPDLDNLFAPQGVIQAAQELAAAAFGADQTWFLANGSTSGIIAAILATCGPGDRLLVPRNVHQSVITGLILSGAIPIFINPDYDPHLDLAHSITPAAVATALEQYADIKAVLMVYPTYYGVCGDIEAIAHLTHQHNIPLLIDEAHGPHFAFHPALPTPALAAGADLVVQSTHKVLTAFTQAAMLHCRGNLINPSRISQALQFVQSTSPSYLLLASLDAARSQMAIEGEQLLTQTLTLAETARVAIQTIPHLSTLDPAQAGLTPGFCTLDPTRLTITVSQLGLTGFAADTILNQQLGIIAELPTLQHLTFIISVGNTTEDIQRLVQAFATLAQTYSTYPSPLPQAPLLTMPYLPALSPREAFFSHVETVELEQALGRISAELVCPYPPGIPILLPGERIELTAIHYLKQVLTTGGFITGAADSCLQTLQVVQ